MSMLGAWLAFPAILAAVTVGCGLFAERIGGGRIPGPLLPASGLAVVVVAAQLATLTDATAELAAPLAVALAAAGFALALTVGRRLTPEPWAVLAAVGAFVAFGTPVLLSGEPTFTGYVKLDDTATWLAITDRVMEHGRDLDGLRPSTYEAALDLTLGRGYPIGAFLPLGVGAKLSGQDAAWVFQPYMATLAAILASGLVAVVAPIVRSERLRAAAGFLAAQPALLFGYSLWGGAKEIAAAALLPAVAGLATAAGARAIVPVAIAAGAVVAVLGLGGLAWVVPLVAIAIGLALRWEAAPAAARSAAAALGAVAVLAVPALAVGGILRPWVRPLVGDGSLGTLISPLSPFQVVGIWPSGDFRLDPDLAPLMAALIAIAIAAAAYGVASAVRARAMVPVTYLAGTLAACAAVVAIGSPWVDAKALAIGSPAAVLAAASGAAVAVARGGRRRVAGTVALVAIAAGVVWSNALAYREVTLAPRAELAELSEIGKRTAGEGPTLITEAQPYGTRHFLRGSQAEGTSELRRHHIALRDGSTLRAGRYADLDELDPESVRRYRTLIVRRSPAASRPSAQYALAFRGEYYDVWQRRATEPALAHRRLGTAVDPVGVPPCGAVRRLGRLAGPRGVVAAAARQGPVVVPLTEAPLPDGWERAGAGVNRLVPRGGGELRLRMRVPRAGRYAVWVGGSVRSGIQALVDGAPAGEVGHLINSAGQYVRVGAARIARGRHELTLRVSGASLRPGSGGQPIAIGPAALSRTDAASSRIVRVGSEDAEERLCGRPWDWIEAESSRPRAPLRVRGGRVG